MSVFGGVEGGATHSTLVLFNEKSEALTTVEGPGTNLFQIGMDETCHRIAEMICQALKNLGLPQETTLQSLGLSLSGCEVEETNKELGEKFMKLHPKLVKEVPQVCSDTVGSLLTASEKGGVVLIAGTGSNSLLVNPDGTIARCGGWGHLLGDEGGAWWISQLAMKVWFDDEDNLNKAPYPTTKVAEVIKTYFNVQDRFGLLTYCYDKFEKDHFAGACKSLAESAAAQDPLSQWIFTEAGKVLAKHIVALSSSMPTSLHKSLSVVCIGSVWKSWTHLKTGFVSELTVSAPMIKSFQLLQLKVPMATGACYLAAKDQIVKKYQENTEVFYSQ